MIPPHHENWTDANQRLLTAEFARLSALLGAGDVAAASEELAAAGEAFAQLDRSPAIDALAHMFGLSGFERDVLLLCAGVEMDARLGALCAQTHDHRNEPGVTFGLALGALPDAHWSALTPSRPLRRWRLVEVPTEAALVSAWLRIDERVLHYLAGINAMDNRLAPMFRQVTPPNLIAPSHQTTVDAVVMRLLAKRDSLPIVELTGDDAHGREDVASAVAEQLGLRLYALAASDIPAALHEQDALSVLWERESTLLGSALLVVCDEAREASKRFAYRLSGPLLLSTREALPLDVPCIRHTVDRPEALDQMQLWERVLRERSTHLNGSVHGVATQFRLSARTIETIGLELRSTAEEGADSDSQLWRACRTLDTASLDALAQRIEPAAGWDDLILPESQKATLRQIATHVRNRLTVHHSWGFAGKGGRGLGISALFAGGSGSGKTMAAEVLANTLKLDLYRIDLSAVVSKYIGETEKNLRQVFDAAEQSGALLLFDEADALFGKRTEVKDSHDRYANIEVSYLLQRMESYRGLAILTTNHKKALDSAFQRRLRFIVQFPFPSRQHREAIWRGIFPGATPVDDLDYGKLAALNVSGGTIRNIAINAAFLAAEAGIPVDMSHLRQAAELEATKRDRPLGQVDSKGWR